MNEKERDRLAQMADAEIAYGTDEDKLDEATRVLQTLRRAAALPHALAMVQRGAKAKHTPEPWHAGQWYGGVWAELKGPRGGLIGNIYREDGGANLNRIVACVNACGPKGPVAKLAEAAEAVSDFAAEHSPRSVVESRIIVALDEALDAVRELLKSEGKEKAR
jgi:hypothetical protein